MVLGAAAKLLAQRRTRVPKWHGPSEIF